MEPVHTRVDVKAIGVLIAFLTASVLLVRRAARARGMPQWAGSLLPVRGTPPALAELQPNELVRIAGEWRSGAYCRGNEQKDWPHDYDLAPFVARFPDPQNWQLVNVFVEMQEGTA